MKNNINMFLKGMAGRFSATVVMLALGCLSAIAGKNELKINDVTIQRGETAEVVVCLNNEDKVSSLQFDVVLPDGLEYVDKSVAIATPRITRESHSVGVRNLYEGNKYHTAFDNLRVFLLSTSATIESSLIPGNEGDIVKFTVKASNTFKGGNIIIRKIIISDQTTTTETGAPTKDDIDDTTAKVYLYAGVAYADVDAQNVRPGENAEVGVSFDNVVDVVALQAVVTLPKGVSFDEAEKIIYNDDRLSSSFNASVKPIENQPNSYSLLLASFSGDVFNGNTGSLFSLNLKTAEGFTEGEVEISDIKVSTVDGISCNVSCKEGMTLTTNIKVVTDPNGDGAWDILDIYQIVDAMADDDNSVSIVDIYDVIDKM